MKVNGNIFLGNTLDCENLQNAADVMYVLQKGFEECQTVSRRYIFMSDLFIFPSFQTQV